MTKDEDRKEPGWLNKPLNLRRLEDIQGPSWKKPKNDVQVSPHRDDKVEAVEYVVSSLSPLPFPATEEGHHVNDCSPPLTYNTNASSNTVPVMSYRVVSHEEWDKTMAVVLNLNKKVFNLEDKLAQANSATAQHEIVESTADDLDSMPSLCLVMSSSDASQSESSRIVLQSEQDLQTFTQALDGYPVMKESVASSSSSSSSSSTAVTVIENAEVSSLQNITSTANIAVQEDFSSNDEPVFTFPDHDYDRELTVSSQLNSEIPVRRNRRICCHLCGLKYACKGNLARHIKYHCTKLAKPVAVKKT